MLFCMFVCHAAQALLRAAGCLLLLLNYCFCSGEERRAGFVPGCLAYAAENEGRMEALLSSPLPKTPHKQIKQWLHPGCCLEKKSISGKTVENSDFFKKFKWENNFIKRYHKMLGNDPQIRNQITETQVEKEGENTAEERLQLSAFE